jgi:hypothetical protein
MIRLWTLHRHEQVDFANLCLLTRLARQGWTDVDWVSLLPFLFSVIGNSLDVPTSLIATNPAPVPNFQGELIPVFFRGSDGDAGIYEVWSGLVVTLFTDPAVKGALREKLDRLFHQIAPFFTPMARSGQEDGVEVSVQFLNELVDAYGSRAKHERLWVERGREAQLRPQPLLTAEDHEWFVSRVLRLAVVELFREVPQFAPLDILAQLCPSLVIPRVLDAVAHVFEYRELRAGCYQTLLSLAPTVFVQGDFVGDYLPLVREMATDVDFNHPQRTSMISQLMSVMASYLPADEIEDIARSFVDRALTFFEHARGVECRGAVVELVTSLTCVIRSASPGLVRQLVSAVAAAVERIPNEALPYLIDAVDVAAVPAFGTRALLAEDKKDMIILHSMLKKNPEWVLEQAEAICATLERSLGDDERRHRAVLAVKGAIRSLLSVMPLFPFACGVVPPEAEQPWHVPSDAEVECALTIAERFLALADAKLRSTAEGDAAFGAKLSRAVLKGLSVGVSINDLEPEPDPGFEAPLLRQFSDKRVSSLYTRVMFGLLERVEGGLEGKALRTTLRAILTHLSPQHPLAAHVGDLADHYSTNSQVTRLRILLGRNSLTPLLRFSKARELLALRLVTVTAPVTALARKVLPKLVPFATHSDARVRELASTLCTGCIARFEISFLDVLSDCIRQLRDPALSDESYAGLCGVVSAVASLPVLNETVGVLFDAARAVMREVPDVPDESPRSLQQLVVSALDTLSLDDSRLSNVEHVLELRDAFVHEAIVWRSHNRVSHDADKFVTALVCSLALGCKCYIEAEVFEFLCRLLMGDDASLRDCVMSVLPTLFEALIPREPRPRGVKVERVTAENYDSVAFVDRQQREQATSRPRFWKPEELLDEAAVGAQLPAHEALFAWFRGEKNHIAELLRLLNDAQMHREEAFSKGRVFFWYSACRFFDVGFTVELSRAVLEFLRADVSHVSAHVVAAEIFSGAVRSLKGRPWSDVERASVALNEWTSFVLCEVDPELHQPWYLAFFAAGAELDQRRLFWLYEHLLAVAERLGRSDVIPHARVLSFAVDVLLDAATALPYLRDGAERLMSTFFEPSLLGFETVRECAVRAMTSAMNLAFDVEKRGFSPDAQRLFDRFIAGAPQQFLVRWLLGQFSNQTPGSVAAGDIVLSHLGEWLSLILVADETEQVLARSALACAVGSNMLGSLCGANLSGAAELVDRVLDQLAREPEAWQSQMLQLLLLECFLGRAFFFVGDSVLEGLISECVLEGLMQTHPDVQDSASQLLSFVVRASLQLVEKMPSLIGMFRTMLRDPESFPRRIAGAKGLAAIVFGVTIFDSVPDFVLEAMGALKDAMEVDRTIEGAAAQFFSDFFDLYDNNLMRGVAELLAPFHESMKPSYLS